MTPLDEYTGRKSARELAVEARERTHIRLGNAKVAIFILVMGYWAITLNGVSHAAFYAVAVGAFIVLAAWHERTMRALARAQAAVTFYANGIARIDDRWDGIGLDGDRFRNAEHPYADDLDLFGPASLFQLICVVRTPMGEARLASWLLAPTEPAALRERQSRVAALRPHIDLRERIAVVNAVTRRRLLPEPLIAWAEAPPALPRWPRLIVMALAASFGGALLNFLFGGGAALMGWLVPFALAVLWWLFKPATHLVEGLSSATEAAGLDLLSRVIGVIERESFDDPALAALAARLKGGAGAAPASRGIAGLGRVTDWADSRHNVFARLLEVPALFTLQVAYAAESWKAHHGARLRDWVDAVGEMEALLSLAGYAFEHPGDPFPEILDDGPDGALFDGEDLTHPLIAAAVAVRNSVVLGRGARVLMVSGSNMSGKSTLMRTVGVNTVLALAGAPVRASRLRLTPLAVGTSLRHADSLHEGRSGFYAEALRLRVVADLLAGPRPLLFLFDELMSGTNSKDRRIAAEGLVGAMLARRAIGMVTTHDLSLTEIAAVFPGQVRNVHLQDHVEDGRMRFDYKLREGVITHSNALELMRMIGLDV